jgi:hypothetical protein
LNYLFSRPAIHIYNRCIGCLSQKGPSFLARKGDKYVEEFRSWIRQKRWDAAWRVVCVDKRPKEWNKRSNIDVLKGFDKNAFFYEQEALVGAIPDKRLSFA